MGEFTVSVVKKPTQRTSTDQPVYRLTASGEGSEKECDVIAARFSTDTRKFSKYEDLLFKMGAMLEAPCFCCGYDGSGYFQSGTHKCAERHHKLYKTETSE
jgi:hypothetical protein